MIVVLADIRSSHNVGSIFRTADAAGCTQLYLCGITPCPRDRFGRSNAEISKVALGAEEWIPWEYARSCVRRLTRLKKEGYTILALEQSKHSVPYAKVHISKKQWTKTVLVVGNEVAGLSRTILRKAETIIEIPMHGKKESLNVAVAFGVVIFSLRR
ncbi:TrmH family RNA methyltransferase [Candidatus Uhrbacteria bacterium]|nr:TrmH family RNA methyltransferase [Candidatus Uhrbacteria bacterium]